MGVLLAFFGCVLIWGSTWYAIELQLGIVPKEWSLVYRFGLASLVLFAICLLKRERLRIKLRNHVWMAITGMTLFSTGYVFTYWGTEYLTSGLVAVTFSMLSFLNIVNARIFLGNPITLSTIGAALIGIVGLVLIFMPEISTLSLADDTTLGVALCLIATVVASLGNVSAGAASTRSVPVLSFNAWSLGYGALTNLVFALASGKAIAFDPHAPYVLSLLYLSLVGTVIAFSMYVWLIGKIGVGRAAYMAVMVPVVALVISTLLEGFVWTVEAMIGLSLVIIGNVTMIRRKAPAAKPCAPDAAQPAK
ncbi:DMT family transporter [Kordiimonas aestuarii]|uniref:DMT family transporter n=1 Tax=Kordiimonas aestuarii TaxID=1005925 RepID=UPI0021D1F0D3|nr:DMT family transporter [Kordiimonas aestuarii]